MAGDAPTIERADDFLGKAIVHIEQKGLTNGNSAYMFSTPKNDLSIWYNQLKEAKKTTEDIIMRAGNDHSSAMQLEKSNALMKIREVVLDNSSSGTSVTLPANISWYPNQWLMLIWWSVTGSLLVVGWFIALQDYY